MDVHASKNVSIGIDPYPYGFFYIEVLGAVLVHHHWGFHFMLTFD
jgi:hypothetical protein